MSLVLVGKIGRPHGLRGELVLDHCSLTPDELMEVKHFTWRGRDQETPLTISSARAAHPRVLVGFLGYDERERAATLTLGDLMVESDRLPDPGPGVAYQFQLMGLEVRTEEGRVLGKLTEIIPTGAYPVYVARGEREWMIPATPEVVRKVDLQNGLITVVLPAGLEELSS
jgi:16S rRNA processing protein RimM